jgi:hypothetical protein
MSSIADLQHAIVGNLRAAIIVQPRRFGERSKHIQLRQRAAVCWIFGNWPSTSSRTRWKISYSSFTLRSSAPRILPSISFSSGVMKRSPLAMVCLRM